MDTKKEDTDVQTAPEVPALPATGEPGPGPSAVPSEPLHGPVDMAEDSLEGLRSAFWGLSVKEVHTQPVKRRRERERRKLETKQTKEQTKGKTRRIILPSRAHQALLASTHHPLL